MLGKDVYMWFIPLKPILMDDGYKYEISQQNYKIEMDFHRLIHSKRQALWSKHFVSAKKKVVPQ